MKINYKLKEIYKRIFLVTIKDQYDLAMTFCRLQEYYESPFKQVRGKTFNMAEFQRMYAKKFGDGVFTYPVDWAGFNVPGAVVDEFMSANFEDWGNEYDFTIGEIHWKITDEHKSYNDNNPYYLIGAEPKDKDTIKHEMCHALYYLDKEYQESVNCIISELNRSVFAQFRSHLLNIGYSKQVITDEINAYICIDSYQLTDSAKMNKREKKNFQHIQSKLQELFAITISARKNNR
jgi:hypothetical protein